MYHESYENEDENEYGEEVVINPVLTARSSEREKGAAYSSCMEMRNDASFCDVAFLVQGCLFRAHKIVVSSWSRWLYALLSEGPDQEIISLDVFTPNEFGAILDYMYGDPLLFSLENAEDMLKVIRRLEMRSLEQRCWKHLMAIVNSDNCRQLHGLADYFDCAPLKVTAWRLIQESKPGYSSAPSELLETMNALIATRRGGPRKCGHGLTGPGENPDPLSEQADDDDNESDEGEGDIFSIFTSTSPGANAEEGLLSSSLRKYSHYVRPDQLPRGTPAAEVVRAWAFRLQEVYNECCEAGADMGAYSLHHRQDRQEANGQRADRSEDGIDYGDDRSTAEIARRSIRASSTDSANMERMPAVHRMTSKGSSLMGSVNRQTSRESLQSDLTMESPPRATTIAQPRGSASQALLQSHIARSKSRERESSQRLPVFEEKDDDTSASPVQHGAMNWKEELARFYTARGLPEKLSSLDEILAAWAGKEVEMMEVLHEKYNIAIPPDLAMKIRSVQQ